MGNCVQASSSQVESPSSKAMHRKMTSHTLGEEGSLSSRESFKYSKNTCALEYWEPMSSLGDGSISTVHLARRRPQRVNVPYKERSDILTRSPKSSEQPHDDNAATSLGCNICALKSVHHDHVGNNTILRDAKDEVSILSKLSHPNIVRLVEGYERRRHVYMLMEVCSGGDLHQVEGTTEQQAKEIVYQILSAVAYMHEMGVVHRDLKLANILFTGPEQTEIKIIDFGMATEYSHSDEKLTKRVGTIYCMAPEVLKGSYDNKCDLWSVGIIAYILLSGTKPFWGPNVDIPWSERRAIMIDRILRGDYVDMEGGKWESVSPDGKAFVKSLLELDPSTRPSAEDALRLPWMVDSGTGDF